MPTHSKFFLSVCILMNILEVKIVKHMPELKASEQPTIAIVTSLFCEKVAVDAMIEEKTTYVKYKTEGCYKINLDIFHFIILFLCALICLPFVWAILICQIQPKTTSLFVDIGESQVYTLGRIGKFKVVSTKVSRKSSSEQESRICAENTITRLLGMS